MESVLFSARSGLANRLRALAGCRALASLAGVPLRVEWPRNGACDASFDSLFAATGREDVELVDADRCEALRREPGCRVLAESLGFAEIGARFGAELAAPEAFAEAAVAKLRSLVPAAPLQERIEAFLAAHDLAGAVGVHVRQTDNQQAYAGWRGLPDFDPACISQLEGFEALISRLEGEGRPVFLATDNDAVERRLLARHGNVRVLGKQYDASRHGWHVRRSFGPLRHAFLAADRLRGAFGPAPAETWRTTPVADALVDLRLLGHCAEVVGTYFSSFGEVAADWGGVSFATVQGAQVVPFRRG